MNEAKILESVQKNGFYDKEIDPSLDLFDEINKLKKEKLGINNYSLAAFKREKIFKEIILENGETLKQNISKKAGIKISSTLKDKILNGEWMPNTSNRFTHFQWKYKNLKFRSSWEMIFYVLNEQKKLELETIRIKYFNTKKNKEQYNC